MRKNVRAFSITIWILLILGIYVQAQPTRVAEIPNESTNFVTIGDLVYFLTGTALWRTDGTASGTISLKSYYPWAAPSLFREFNGMAIFMIGGALWRSDGSPEGTIRLADNLLGYLSSTDKYFFFRGGASDTGFEVYRTDGTVEGTRMVKDVWPGERDGYKGFHGVVGDQLLFAGEDGIHGIELWKTDGTSAGTLMVKDINLGSADGFAGGLATAFSYNNLFYFRAQTAETGNEPWVSDGTAEGTSLLKDIVEGPGSPARLSFNFGHEQSVYFVEMTQTGYPSGTIHLWKTSGTTASTIKIKTIGEPGTQHFLHSFLPYQDKVYFFDNEDYFEDVLWETDGTPAGTNSFFTLSTEGPDHYFDEVNNYMLFTGSGQSQPTPLYRSDGTSSGTQVVTRFKSGGSYDENRHVREAKITTVNDLAFYADHDGPTDEDTRKPYNQEDYLQLMQTDGVTTQSVRTLHGVSTVGTDNITNFNGKVIFTTRNDQDGSTDTQKYLWIYNPNSSGNEQVGKIQQEVWDDVPGTKVSSIPVDEEPSSVKDLTIFETASNAADHYGSRVRGYVMVPQTGNYTFWIASDDQSQLWLSTDADPANKVKIAEVTGWTTSRQWGKYTSQQSAAISLVAGRKYYIEALHKEGTGGDNLAVGWRLPDGTMERPIPGNRLISFKSEPPAEPCAGAGMIRQEFWTGVSGTRVSDIPVNEEPDFTQDLTIFEGPASAVGDNYGSRIRGYICPPASGNYVFWIAGDDQVELSLSTDDNAANKKRIAYHTGWTNKREWMKYATQQSAAITLQAGQRYYIEALMKEGLKADHISVGWQQPDGTLERPIAGSHLIPFGASDPDPDPTCAGTGTISVETWTGIDGTRVSSIPVDSPPDLTGERNIFEAPTNIGSNFGSRFRGYVCVPTSGNYTFWIASDDHSELWLSTDADPANKRLIAHHTGWTSPRQWTKYTTQQSAPISLVTGRQYYIEALYKEDEGGDNLAVGWELPDGTLERPIPGNRLSPFKEASSTMAERTALEEELYLQVSIYPNPAKSGDPKLTISGYEGIVKTIETQIQIINMTGEVVFADRISCGGDCSSYLMNINKQLVPGVYVVKIETDGVRSAKRLLVK